MEIKSLISLIGISAIILSSSIKADEENSAENSIGTNDSEGSWDIREFDRSIRDSEDNGQQPQDTRFDNFRTFINFPKIYRNDKFSIRDEIRHGAEYPEVNNEAKIIVPSSPSTSNQERKVLPERFSYVVREFYRYYSQQHGNDDTKKKLSRKILGTPEPKADDNLLLYGDNDADARSGGSITELSTSPVPEILWRNIIGGPTYQCPKGQRKDSKGRCRKTLW